MQIILYKNFSKKINSTKQPDNTVTSVTIDAVMKQPTSLENPIFLINGIDLEVNYCKWADHYYFVDDIVLSNNNIYEIHCRMDVLATWKTEIGTTTQYIERASTNNPVVAAGGLIPDTMYPTLGTVTKNVISMTGAPSWQNGLYVLSFIQQDPQTYYDCGIYRGGIVYAILTAAQMQSVMIDIRTAAISHPDVNVLNLFPSLTYIPFNTNIESAGTTYEYVITGSSNVSIPRNIIPPEITSSGLYTAYMNADAERYAASLPRHPQVTLGDYTDYKPFNQYTLHAGPFGDIDLPQELLSFNATSQTFDFWMAITYDICTGEGILHILPTSDETIANAVLRKEANIGVSIAISELSAVGSGYARQKFNLSKITTVTSGIVKTAARMALSGPAGGVTQAAGTLVTLQSLYYDYIQASLPGVYTNGSNGSFADFIIPCNITQTSRDMVLTRADDKYGRPVNMNLQINTIPGYIKCHTFTAEIPCHISEYEAIEAYAVAGFYYE